MNGSIHTGVSGPNQPVDPSHGHNVQPSPQSSRNNGMVTIDGAHDVSTGLQSITEYHSVPGTSQAIGAAQVVAVKAPPPEGGKINMISPGTPGEMINTCIPTSCVDCKKHCALGPWGAIENLQNLKCS